MKEKLRTYIQNNYSKMLKWLDHPDPQFRKWVKNDLHEYHQEMAREVVH
ncbi:MAG: hypothetical protein KAR42_17365 [candidate division Zixibacteria bacterium]|nr:hypothetical protein [candidate division Zixibacteria bacterium]